MITNFLTKKSKSSNKISKIETKPQQKTSTTFQNVTQPIIKQPSTNTISNNILKQTNIQSNQKINLNIEKLPNIIPQKSFIDTLFSGVQLTEKKCLSCSTVSCREEEFRDLSIEIEPDTTVEACLANYCATETLTGDQKYYCERCNSKTEAHTRIRIKTMPPVLIIHLKRFKFCPISGIRKKLNYRVAYPETLKCDEIMAGYTEKTIRQRTQSMINRGRGASRMHNLSTSLSVRQTFNSESMCEGKGNKNIETKNDECDKVFSKNGNSVSIKPPPEYKNVEVKFNLCSVVIHCGEASNKGHYITAVKTIKSDNNCLVLDDETSDFRSQFKDFYGFVKNGKRKPCDNKGKNGYYNKNNSLNDNKYEYNNPNMNTQDNAETAYILVYEQIDNDEEEKK